MKTYSIYQYALMTEEGALQTDLVAAEARTDVLGHLTHEWGPGIRILSVQLIPGLVPVMLYGQWTGQAKLASSRQGYGVAG